MEASNVGVYGSTNLKDIYSKFDSEEQMVEAYSESSLNLISLFEMATGVENQKFVKDTDLINKIYKKIEIFDLDKKLNDSQINRILSLSKNISTFSCYLNFFAKHLNMDNVFNFVKYAKEANSEIFVKGLDYISRQTGIKIKVINNSLTIAITESKIPWNQLSNDIIALSKVYEDQLTISFSPKKDEMPNVLEFIKSNGKLITSSNLLYLNVDDEFVGNLILSCPNLYELFIHSDKIEGKGLVELGSLKSLTRLYLSGCDELIALPETLPCGLTELYLSSCNSLTALPNSLPPSLTALDLSGCWLLTALPNILPSDLEILDLSGCEGLTELPDTLPSGLKVLDLSGCESLTDDIKLMVLSRILNEDFFQGLKLAFGFYIDDQTQFNALIIPKLDQKMSDPFMLPNDLMKLTYYIIGNQIDLRLHNEHPLLQEAINISRIYEQPGLKNPFSLYKNLKKLAKVDSTFVPEKMCVEGINVRINMDQLKAMGEGFSIKRTDLPELVTLKSFNALFSDLKKKVENDFDRAFIELRNLGTDWNTIFIPIEGDHTQQLRGYLSLTGENVSETEAKWRAILSNIFAKDKSAKNNPFFTEQEEVFILTMMGIQNCQGGKAAGIALSYEQLDSMYRYKVKLSKALSPMEEDTEVKKLEAMAFIEEFISSQPIETSQEELAKNLVKIINANLREYSINITPWLEDESFWDEESYELNEIGAIELLKIEKREEAKKLFSQLIGQTIQKSIEVQFSGTNPLMEELTGTNAISQGSHQSIYLKNLIGHLIGVSQAVTFDRHTAVLYDNLIDKSREIVLKTFFKYVTPKTMVNEILRTLKEPSTETIEALKAYLSEDKYWDEKGAITKPGVLKLLIDLNYLY